LTLLVAGILANDANDAGAPDDTAAFAQSFHGWSNFHGKNKESSVYEEFDPEARQHLDTPRVYRGNPGRFGNGDGTFSISSCENKRRMSIWVRFFSK
jgi:hypothetical protein